MGVSLALVDNDDIFNRLAIPPVIINDVSSSTEEDKEYVNHLISTRYDTDLLSNEPRCGCGKTTGGFKIGMLCDNCREPVKELFDQDLQSLVWMRSPHGVEKLINPMVLTQLSQKFTKNKFNIIEWLCNTDYHPTINRPSELDELLNAGVVRGYNNFVGNFFKYIDILFSLKSFKPKKGKTDDLQEHLRLNGHCALSWHLPLPNKSMLIIENTQVGIFVDKIVVGAIDAIRTICSIDTKLSIFSMKQKENRTAKALFILSRFCNEVYHDILASKNGLFRKHVFGSRNHFSTRAVISSNTKIHRYDEISISWGAGVTMLKIHLTNKLMMLGWTPNAIVALLQEYTCKYNPLIDSLFKELIAESPDGGFWCIYGRNPSLTRASSQRMKISSIKTDVDDPTISMSILAVKGFNADFDGKHDCRRKTFLIAGSPLELNHQSGARKCKRHGLKTIKIG